MPMVQFPPESSRADSGCVKKGKKSVVQEDGARDVEKQASVGFLGIVGLLCFAY
jgi:hypothetical protein